MSFATRALIISVVFLLEEAVLSQRGICAWNQCCALFLEDDNFLDAKRSCEESYGHLIEFSSEKADATLASLLKGVSGSFWLSSTNSSGSELCSSVSVRVGGNLTLSPMLCSSKLDGFLCQYTFEDPCSILHADKGAQVRYVTHEKFEATESETFPPGTIAEAEKPGGEYPDSRHLCFSRSWIQAPWNCEVLGGGCEHSCNHTTKTCICPAGQTLHPNNVTCTKDPCADCAQKCQKEGDSYVCKCTTGYRLAPDRKTCVDVDECKEESLCTGEGEKCVNTEGGYECMCSDDFDKEDGACVNVSICALCEHMLCKKSNGVYRCSCRKGFVVSAKDPTMCEQHCTERDCPAKCIQDPAVEKDMQQCFCPDGYIRDTRDGETFCTDIDECEFMAKCDHKCENLYGGYKCVCEEGYRLDSDHFCLPDEDDDNGSGRSPLYPTPANVHPGTVPSYIKTGSVMGITMFMLLCAGLLYFLVRNMAKRCGKFELSSLKGSDIDIFYLQQVTTDTYKRLSFDKQSKNDSQRM